jgi:lipid-A-disaccharide synthase-like uncharacterized protein
LKSKGFKWEPVAAMIALLLLGVWIAFAPDVPQPKPPGAERAKLSVGPVKGVLEWQPAASGQIEYRLLYRDGTTVGPMSRADLERVLGAANVTRITGSATNGLYRALNVTSAVGVAWVVLGFAGQLAFSGRWLLQWFVSEKTGSSTVPVAFWWLSMIGSAMLFAYFVWRNDVVGVLGQTSGVVIYARNIRLISKDRRRRLRPSVSA